jgi:hypothetical protein
MWQQEHLSLSLVVLTYAAICMFSYFNVSYVRDFDAIQVNFTPIALTICCIVAIQRHYSFYMVGMVVALAADSYFALRFKENTDKINFSVFERFAMESWSQEAFNKRGQVTRQIISLCLIFAQLYLSIVGAHNKEMICFLIVTFYVARLVQFLMSTCLAINMAQSNFMAICLATLAAFAIVYHPELMSMYTKLSCGLLAVDALLGTAIFMTINQEDIYKELGVHNEFKKMKY